MTHILALVLMLLATGALVGPEQAASLRAPQPRPDFQGTYALDTLTTLERPPEFVDRPFLTEAEARAYVQRRLARQPPLQTYNDFWFDRPDTLLYVDGKYLTSRIVDPPDGRIPALTPAASRRVADATERTRAGSVDGPEDRGLTERCISPTPTTMTTGGESNYVQIVQTPDYLVVYTELMGVRRIIPIGPAKALPSSMRSRSGSSVARWDGDSLVIETTNFAGDFAFAFAAIDENLHLTERLRRIDAGTLRYEATIDDPTAYSRPWSFILLPRRTDARMFEYACHEGNYALANILRGARSAERVGVEDTK